VQVKNKWGKDKKSKKIKKPGGGGGNKLDKSIFIRKGKEKKTNAKGGTTRVKEKIRQKQEGGGTV